ncbi:uncharacterized protein LOC123892041 [Trifolium pratense]|uniref:uncharacterized protein LOC123892041 n=1 Tax=Trifolium pratense TaxID=57577 RepID=UPI001E696607|nr:uncharacterized protein LOC123892041 [Trifolium pratense]
MGEGESSSEKRAIYNEHGFMDFIFSWSIQDILDEEFYKNKVEKIGLSFQSIDHYLESYKYLVLEETRATLCSSMELIYQAPYGRVVGLKLLKSFNKKNDNEMEKPLKNKLYNLKIDRWKNRFIHRGEPYKTLPGDVLVLADCKPESANDLQRFGRMWCFLKIVMTEDENDGENMDSVCFKVTASKDLDIDELRNKSLHIVFLTNVGANRKIWSGLHMTGGNLKLFKQILCTDEDDDVKGICGCTSLSNALRNDCSYRRLSSGLNESQNNAVRDCLSDIHCNHNSTVKLIWGPPGTGKTKTLGTLLYVLMKMKYRILVCAPTNVAIKEVASRVLNIVRESLCRNGDLSCSPGNMLLLGNTERLDIVGEDIEDIFLDSRVRQLRKCLSPYTGWRHCFESMINLLKYCVYDYHIFVNDIIRLKKPKSFLEFLRDKFCSRANQLKDCISMLYTHLPMCLILEHNYRNLVCLIDTLEWFREMLCQDNLSSEELMTLFSNLKMPADSSWYSQKIFKKRIQCLTALETAKYSLDRLKLKRFADYKSVKEFCYENASIIFCTTSTSFKLHKVSMKPVNILVIDEAAQLKECESIIPLQLPGIRHAILVGDECQLPAMVRSNICTEAGFGRSLFERLSLFGSQKNLLNMQHRMHPEISSFPNSYFYSNKILDAPNVERNYGKQYLPGPMFGPYCFINVAGGREEYDDDGRSYMNMAEVAVVVTILKNLHKAWLATKEKLSIGIVSPYAGQVLKIQEKLERMNDIVDDGFNVNVKSIDGFQGGEQDIIILSTVRTNYRTSLWFVSSPQRTNVALTRARYCLWILGNERALASNENVWKSLVLDSKNRGLFFHADRDTEMAKAILDSIKELDRFVDLLDTDSIIFRNTMWKVHFSDKFRRSFKRVRTQQSKNSVINVLERLANGWRPRGHSIEIVCENSSKILNQFKVESRYIICSIEIVKDLRGHIQVLKMWDLVPVEDIPQLAKRLDCEFRRYTDEYFVCCKEKGFDGKIEFPLSWPRSANIQKFKSVGTINTKECDLVPSENKNDAAQNSMIEESSLLMKFCSITPDYTLTNCDSIEVDLPFELTEEQRSIVVFPRSTFLLGRSGTGKTTVLTTKMIRNEKLHRVAVERVYGPYSNPSESSDRPVLRQLFVTLSPGLCQEIKHHVTCFKRSLGEIGSTDEDIDHAKDSFSDLPSNLYPLVITFRKFLLMLDSTLGNSYIRRFSDLKKEVNYERFESIYWPRFNSQLIKKLDSYLVFTEIMSHIKGGIKEADTCKLSREDYCTLSESRTSSSLSMKTREMIYDIFQNYEKIKMQRGEFDMADIVIDLHHRLRTEKYKGDLMNFVFIDEVQDLTMAHISLFKHICRNVEDGFVFCGDTAQTIGRGIDFRFQDVRSLFYKNFVSESKSRFEDKKNQKVKNCASDIFMLSQKFSTHAELLKLSQSIIELLFHFFPNSIDMLKVETSLVYGESPVVIQSRNGENPILTIFGGNGRNIGKFLEDQVILVRDDSTKEEISRLIGKQAQVLTIFECKGLEFKDVLLYNFFASSPLKRRWGIIYEYMKEKDMLEPKSHINCQGFVDSKHNVLCSELKQLYVALTRASKRLWICEEDVEEFFKPMFSYWEKKNLVQFKILDS